MQPFDPSPMRLIIIGGGIAGLSSAYYALQKAPHLQITLYQSRF
jgi:protoporphyrinogen oxidase